MTKPTSENFEGHFFPLTMTGSTQPRLLTLSERVSTQSARTVEFMGRTFRVIPAVLVQGQVLVNNIGRMFLPSERITPEWADMWNGIPVIVGPHPTINGQSVSGRNPEILDARGVGFIFNAFTDTGTNGTRRLRGEVWIDTARVTAVQELERIFERLDEGGLVELSTGFETAIEITPGEWHGEAYDQVMNPLSADHLIITADLTGACSVAHGCGLGVVNTQPNADVRASMLLDAIKTGAKQTMSLFTRSKPATQAAEPTAWQKTIASNLERLKLAFQTVTETDQQHALMLENALQDKFGGAERHVCVTDVYSSTPTRQVIFFMMTPMGPNPSGMEYFRCDYEETSTGVFTFTEPVRVLRMVSYEPIGDSSSARQTAAGDATTSANNRPCGCGGGAQHTTPEEVAMTNEEKVSLISEVVSAVSGQIATQLAAFKAEVDAAKTAAQNTATEVVNAAVSGINTAVAGIKDQITAINTSVNEARDTERQELVQFLSTNSRTAFTQAELEAMPLPTLQKLNDTVGGSPTYYGARGGPRSAASNTSESEFAEPLPYFKKPEAAK